MQDKQELVLLSHVAKHMIRPDFSKALNTVTEIGSTLCRKDVGRRERAQRGVTRIGGLANVSCNGRWNQLMCLA